jgi:hypothetical protein
MNLKKMLSVMAATAIGVTSLSLVSVSAKSIDNAQVDTIYGAGELFDNGGGIDASETATAKNEKSYKAIGEPFGPISSITGETYRSETGVADVNSTLTYTLTPGTYTFYVMSAEYTGRYANVSVNSEEIIDGDDKEKRWTQYFNFNKDNITVLTGEYTVAEDGNYTFTISPNDTAELTRRVYAVKLAKTGEPETEPQGTLKYEGASTEAEGDKAYGYTYTIETTETTKFNGCNWTVTCDAGKQSPTSNFAEVSGGATVTTGLIITTDVEVENPEEYFDVSAKFVCNE